MPATLCATLVTPADVNTTNDSLCAAYNTGLGIAGTTSALEAVAAYPNPATDVLNLRMAFNTAQAITLTVLDAQGRVLSTRAAIAAGSTTLQIPTADLAQGFYLLNLRTDAGQRTLRFNIVR